MPLYVYKCDKCGEQTEALHGVTGDAPLCCGNAMLRMPTFPSMVKWKGEGGFPSLRKASQGSAPYTAGYRTYREDLKETDS